MRNKTNNSRLSIVLAVAVGILALTVAPQALAADPVTIKDVSVSGAIVLVTVKNVTMAPVVSSIAVEAEVNGSSSFSIVPVVLLPGQTTVVSAAFTGAVANVKSVGISLGFADEPTPM